MGKKCNHQFVLIAPPNWSTDAYKFMCHVCGNYKFVELKEEIKDEQ